MFKIIGSITILILDVLIIKYIIDKKNKEIQLISDTITFLKCITINLKELKMPLGTSITSVKNSISDGIDNIIECYLQKTNSPRENIISAFESSIYLDKNTKNIVVEYLNIVGRTTKEGMEDYLKVTVEKLEYILTEKMEKNKIDKKTINAYVYSFSLFFILIFF